MEQLSKVISKRGRPRTNVNLDDLMRLRAAGLSFRQIARILGIAPSTTFHLWRDGTTPRNGRKGVQKSSSPIGRCDLGGEIRS